MALFARACPRRRRATTSVVFGRKAGGCNSLFFMSLHGLEACGQKHTVSPAIGWKVGWVAVGSGGVGWEA